MDVEAPVWPENDRKEGKYQNKRKLSTVYVGRYILKYKHQSCLTFTSVLAVESGRYSWNSWQEGQQLGRNVPEKQCSSLKTHGHLHVFSLFIILLPAYCTSVMSQFETPVCSADSLSRMRLVSSWYRETFKARTELTILLLDHRLGNSQRVDESVVVLWMAAFVLVDFPLDLFGCVLIVVLFISGHRLQGGRNNRTVSLNPGNCWKLPLWPYWSKICVRRQ